MAWMDDFMAECDNIEGGCGLKYLAVHSYACEVMGFADCLEVPGLLTTCCGWNIRLFAD